MPRLNFYALCNIQRFLYVALWLLSLCFVLFCFILKVRLIIVNVIIKPARNVTCNLSFIIDTEYTF